MAKGRAVAIVLEATEKSELAALTRKHGAPQALAERARIILAAASGLNNKEIADKVGVCAATVGTWRNRFAESRMDGHYDEPASWRAARDWRRRDRRHDPQDAGNAAQRRNALLEPRGRWARRSATRPRPSIASGRAFGLQPHRVEDIQTLV